MAMSDASDATPSETSEQSASPSGSASRAARNGIKAVFKEWLRFVGANLVGALVNFSVYAVLVHSGPAPFDDKYVAQVCGVLAGMMFNFFLSKYFVFSSRTN